MKIKNIKTIILLLLNIIICGTVSIFFWQNYEIRKMELFNNKQENLLFNYTALWNAYKLVSESFYKDINISIRTDILKGSTEEQLFKFQKPKVKNENNQESFSSISTKGESSGGFKITEEFTGFHYTFPLYIDNFYVGKAETKFTFEDLRKEMEKIFPATYNFIVHKNIVIEKIPEKDKSKYNRQGGVSGFYTLYTEPKPNINNSIIHISNEKIAEINKKIESSALKNLGDGKPFWLWLNEGKKGYTIIFLPINKENNQHVGYLTAYYKDFSIKDIQKEFETKMFIVFILFLCVFVFTYYTYQNEKEKDKVNEKLEENKKELERRAKILEKMNKFMTNRELKIKELRSLIEKKKK